MRDEEALGRLARQMFESGLTFSVDEARAIVDGVFNAFHHEPTPLERDLAARCHTAWRGRAGPGGER